jgi:hypothetical protein
MVADSIDYFNVNARIPRQLKAPPMLPGAETGSSSLKGKGDEQDGHFHASRRWPGRLPMKGFLYYSHRRRRVNLP